MNQFAKISSFFIFTCFIMLSSIESQATVYYSYTQLGGSRNAQLQTSWKSNTNGTGTSPSNFTGADEFRVQAGDSLYSFNGFNLPAGKLVLAGDKSRFYALTNNTLTLDMGPGALYQVEGPYTNLTFGSISPNSTLTLYLTASSSIDFTKTYVGNLEIRSKYLYTFNIGNNLSVGGNLIIGTINATRLNAGLTGNTALNVGGDLIIGNNTTFAPCLPNATNSPILNIAGNLTLINNSIFHSSRGSGNPTYSIGGDLNAATGSVFYGPTSSTATINVVYSIGKNLIINGTYSPKGATSASTLTFSFPLNAFSSSITYGTTSTIYTHALSLSKAVSLATNCKTETLTLNTGGSLLIGANTLTIDKPINYSGGLLVGGSTSNLAFSNLNGSPLTLNAITLQSLNVTRKNTVPTFTPAGVIQITGSITTSYVNVINSNLISLANNATLVRDFNSTYDVTPTISGIYNLSYPTTVSTITGPEASTSGTALFNLTTAGALTLNKSLTTNGTLTTLSASGNVLQNGYTLTIKGNISNNGSFTTGLTSRTSLLRFSGTTVLSGSGTYSLPTVLISTGASLTSTSGNINILGNASVESSSYTFVPNGGSVTYSASFDQNIAPINYYNLLLSGSGGKKIFSTTAVTKIGNLFSAGTALLITTNSSIEFNGLSDQLIPVITYYNLAVSNAGNKILSGTTSVTNNLSITGSAILLPVANSLNVGGNWSSYSNAGFSEGTSTVAFNGSGAQNISVLSGNETFYNLTINKSGGTATLANPTSVSNKLTLTKGSLVSNGNLTVNLNFATIDGSGTGTVLGNITVLKSFSAPNDRTHYIAVPLTGTTPSSALMDDVEVISSYSHTSRLNRFDIPTKSFKLVSDTNMALTPLTSYSLFFTIGNTTLDYTGVYNHTASYSLPLANATSGSYHIGNPFPSTIDWNAANGWTKTNLNDAIALWNANTNKYDTYINGVATGSASQYIAPFQGFVVSASEAGATVGMTNAVRSNTITSTLRTAAHASDLIRIKVNAGSDFDETIIGFDEYATARYDGTYDAPKYMNDESVPSLYSTDSSGAKLAVNTYSSSFKSLTIPLSIENGNGGSQTLTFDGFEDLSNYNITLKDLSMGKSIAIHPGDGYTFNNYSSSSVSRFSLTIEQNTSNETNVVNIYSFDKTVYINAPTTVVLSSIDLFDTFGKLVKSIPASNTSHFEIPVNELTSGIYIVRTNSNTGVTTQKVIIK